jgi:3-dehydroquinate dehydratase-2
MAQSDKPTIMTLNGPNLNLLGVREPEIYGSRSLEDIADELREAAEKRGLAVDFRQSNSEGELVGWVQEAGRNCAGLILNAAALTHTSIALLDAVSAITIPVIEVHLSNIYRREDFRHMSYISKAATGVICGLGARGYVLALDALAGLIDTPPQQRNTP